MMVAGLVCAVFALVVIVLARMSYRAAHEMKATSVRLSATAARWLRVEVEMRSDRGRADVTRNAERPRLRPVRDRDGAGVARVREP